MKKVVSIGLKLGLLFLAYLLIFSPETLLLDPMLFNGVKPIDMWHQIRDASRVSPGMLFFWLALASAVKMLGILCGVIRWKLLLRGQGITLPFWYMCYLWFAGRAIGMFIPGTLGLDGWRLVESARYTQEWVKCTTVIAVEKLTGFIALTFLVFITFPLGFQILDINPVLFSGILLLLFSFTSFCLLLLFNPRVIQVVVAVIPTPVRIRDVVNRIGTAATAYSAHRGTLIIALLFGLGVHGAICLMTFCTMMAIRAPNTSILDIFFASPIMIYASVLTPTINGMGVRELVMGYFLGPQSGHDAAVTYGHLGLWTGEFIPFLLSIPLLLLGGRPSRAALQEDLASLRQHMKDADPGGLGLGADQVRAYRSKVFGTLLAGALAGLVAGAGIALAEATWISNVLVGLKEAQMFVWGPIVYGLIFSGAGLGVAAGLLFLYLLFDRFASPSASYALSFAGAFAAGGLVIGIFRLKRDWLAGHAASITDYLKVVGPVIGIALAGALILYILARLVTAMTKARPLPAAGAALALYLVLVLGGVVMASVTRLEQAAAETVPAVQPGTGPNIVLLTVDTLRADYLKLYNPQAAAPVPAHEAFARDAVLFQNGFAQASWTKPAYGTIFSGLYPEQHRATTKNAALPESVETVAELLQSAGYYTQGFPNNPNVSSTFGFDQGFMNYTYLEPSLYFWAKGSSAKLALYEVLRRVRQVGGQKLGKLPGLGILDQIRVTDFYQPAEVVTDVALEWLDTDAATQSPFLLYLHYMDPHDPFMDPEAPSGGYARVRNEHPDPDLSEPMRRAYEKEIAHLDAHLGRLFEGLRSRGLYEDALIIYISDHGEEFYDHEGWWHGQSLYDEVTKVPLLIKLPGNAHGGMVNTDIARQIDLTPTMLHLAGLPKPPVMPGQTLYDPALGLTNHTIAFSYSENDFEGNILQAVRSKAMKIINANEDNPREHETVELYDMVADPQELKNLADSPEHVEPKRSLQQTVADYQRVIEENAAEPTGDVDTQAVEEQLGSLGYL